MPYTAPQLPATLFMSSAQRHAAQRHAPGHSLNQAASSDSLTAQDRPLHKTLRTRMPKSQRSSMSLATTRMRDMFLNTKEREELFTLCTQGDVKKGNNLCYMAPSHGDSELTYGPALSEIFVRVDYTKAGTRFDQRLKDANTPSCRLCCWSDRGG